MRKLMWFTIGFAAACGLCTYFLPVNWIIPGAVVVGLLSALGVPFPSLRRMGLTCLGLAVGFGWFLLFRHSYLLPAIAMDGTEVEAAITITDYSYETNYGVAADGSIELDGKSMRIRVYIHEDRLLEPGDTVTGTFRLRYTAPGGLEDATYHSGKGMFLLGYQRNDVEIVDAVREEVRFYPAILAQRIKGRLRQLFSEDVFPFMQALLLGDTYALSYETDTALKISGIRHIVAVSGLHVTILYSLLSAVTFKKRYLTLILGIPVLFVFAAVAGFTPSVTRACIMVILMLLAQLFHKQYDPPTALAFASLVMLIVNPFVITAVGFQLTVGCVAGIQLFGTPVQTWVKQALGIGNGKNIWDRGKAWFASSLSITLGAMSLTTPLCAYYFGTVSLIGILTNLLTLWVVNLVFNGLIVTLLLSLITMDGAVVFAGILAWPARFVLGTADVLSKFPLAAVYTESVYITAWLAFVYILLAAFLCSRKRRPFFVTGCAILGLCAALAVSWMEPLMDECRITMLDVGQGQSILLQSEGKTFLVDCGGDSDTETANTVAHSLFSQGVFRLDGVILTHCDRDHAGAFLDAVGIHRHGLGCVGTRVGVHGHAKGFGFKQSVELCGLRSGKLDGLNVHAFLDCHPASVHQASHISPSIGGFNIFTGECHTLILYPLGNVRAVDYNRHTLHPHCP